MHGSSPAGLAGQLLPFVDGPAVAGMLLTEAGDKFDSPAELSATIPTKVALAAASYLHAALALASSRHTGPETLDALARDRRGSVRLAVAGNIATSGETLEYLARRAFAWPAASDKVLDALQRTMRPSTYLALARRARTDRTDDVHRPDAALNVMALAGNLARLSDVDETWSTFDAAPVALRAGMAWAAMCGQLPVPVADLIRAARSSERAVMIEAAVRCRNVPLPDDVCDMLIAELASSSRDPEHLPADHEALSKTAELGRAMTPSTVDRYLASGAPELLASLCDTDPSSRAAMHSLSAAQLDLLVAKVPGGTAGVILEHFPAALTREQVVALALKSRGLHRGAAHRLLLHYGAELPATEIAAVLRLGEPQSTFEWLIGATLAPVTLDALECLAANPGLSLFALTTGDAVHTVATYIGRFFTHLPNRIGKSYSSATIERVLNWGGTETVRAASLTGPNFTWDLEGTTGNVAARYVARRLTERFGDDPDAWRTALGLAQACDFETIDAWLDTAAATLI